MKQYYIPLHIEENNNIEKISIYSSKQYNTVWIFCVDQQYIRKIKIQKINKTIFDDENLVLDFFNNHSKLITYEEYLSYKEPINFNSMFKNCTSLQNVSINLFSNINIISFKDCFVEHLAHPGDVLI